MNLKPLAIVAAALSLTATPSAFAWYAPTLNVVVTDTVSQIAPQEWHYSYSVDNQTTCFGNCWDTVLGRPINTYVLGVHTFSIPFFSDAGIIDIASPSGWTYQILNNDSFNLGFGAGTLQWYATADSAYIAMDAALGGFSYSTLYAPGKGPFSTQFGNTETFVGDPAIPLSPNAILAGIGQPNAVPEPATGLLLLAALGALTARRRVTRNAA
ncbi:MAG TPA: PEP-CTERM sorting domain-containing protein [Telluria sp.]|jgi:hypothetical protein